MAATWRLSELVREARGNLGPRQVLFGAVAVVVLSSLGILTGLSATRALEQERDRRAAGGLTWVADRSDERPLAAASCEALNRVDGVAAAGGVVDGIAVSVYPFVGANPLPVRQVTPHALAAWTDEHYGTTLVLGRDLEALGQAALGSTIVNESGTEVGIIGARLDPAVPVGALRASVLVTVAPTAPLSACWVRMQPGAYSVGGQVLGPAFAGQGARVSEFLPASRGPSPYERWADFAGIQPWIAAGALLVIVAALLAWTRRSELAVYRAFGTTRRQLAVVLWIETLAVLVVAASLAGSLSLLVVGSADGGGLERDVSAIMLRLITAAAALTLAVAPALSVLMQRGNLADQLKDR
jgi:hypothetical protein